MINITDIQKYIGGMNFPAEKTELVQQAEAHGAPQEIMQFFERMPSRTYENPQAIETEATQALGGGEDALKNDISDTFKL